MFDPTTQDRFWRKVDRQGPDDCWLWMAAKNRLGYGSFRANGATCRAHRVSYHMAKGCPKGMFVCHACDNPSCVNPAHLFLGTPDDNVKDMIGKGRHVRPKRDESKVAYVKGSSSPNAKLNENQVLEIREKRSLGILVPVMAVEYGVSKSLIYKILQGQGWYHV